LSDIYPIYRCAHPKTITHTSAWYCRYFRDFEYSCAHRNTRQRPPQGYKTPVGKGGGLISGGQRQRIALARALYGDPFLVVLDEPNSSLDALGEQALTKAIAAIRARGGIAVVIAHRPSAVAAVDHILVLNEGRVQAFGTREAILQQVTPPAAAAEKKVERGGRSRR
jgi:ATP-binding cassette, subfamily C, type I secretion system permease/ATPase